MLLALVVGSIANLLERQEELGRPLGPRLYVVVHWSWLAQDGWAAIAEHTLSGFYQPTAS